MSLLISFIRSFVPVLVHQTFIVLFLLQCPVIALFFFIRVVKQLTRNNAGGEGFISAQVKEVSLLPSVIKH